MKTLKLCGYLLLGYVVISVLKGMLGGNETDAPKVRVSQKNNSDWNLN